MEEYKRFNEGKPRISLIPQKELINIIKVFEMGAKKYGDFNWSLSKEPKTFLDSAFRHLSKMVDNETIDEESGLPHAAHVSANMLMFDYVQKKQNMDMNNENKK